MKNGVVFRGAGVTVDSPDRSGSSHVSSQIRAVMTTSLRVPSAPQDTTPLWTLLLSLFKSSLCVRAKVKLQICRGVKYPNPAETKVPATFNERYVSCYQGEVNDVKC